MPQEWNAGGLFHWVDLFFLKGTKMVEISRRPSLHSGHCSCQSVTFPPKSIGSKAGERSPIGLLCEPALLCLPSPAAMQTCLPPN